MLTQIRKKLENEVAQLDYELRITLPAEIQKARELGDLRENAEYKAALERQELVRARIGQLTQRLSQLGTLDLKRLPRDRAAYGSLLKVTDLDSGAQLEYRLVTSEESDMTRGWISLSSPIGRGLMGKQAGDEVTIQTPGGSKQLCVDELTTLHEQE